MIKNKYTIAQILPALNTGGVERGVIEISKALIDNNFKSIVISSGGHMEAQLRRTGGTHYKLDVNSKNPFRWHKIRKELKIILKNENVDLLHLCSRAPAWIAFPLGKTLKIPVITSVHMRFRKTNFFKKIYNSILIKGDLIIAISKHIEICIKNTFPKVSHKIKVVHRGVDLKLFDSLNINPARIIAQAKLIGLKDNVPVIIMASRPALWKGYSILIKALSKVNENFQCILIGAADGDKKFKDLLINKIIKYNLETKVKLVQSSKDIQAAMILADLIVMPSISPEPFGRIIVEAQALGKIPIAFDHGGASETIIDGKTGFLAKALSAESLAEKILLALSMKSAKRESMGNYSKKFVSKNFSHNKMCKLTLSIYKQCIAEYKRKG
jgi:glycosyltransferase involved in cell wall biosynthesis|tara:strand:+ start:1713 stop:2864 length:1152 start_codon:yes stop_codon:yes gene_type:complete